jgi:hypothetical protein
MFRNRNHEPRPLLRVAVSGLIAGLVRSLVDAVMRHLDL